MQAQDRHCYVVAPGRIDSSIHVTENLDATVQFGLGCGFLAVLVKGGRLARPSSQPRIEFLISGLSIETDRLVLRISHNVSHGGFPGGRPFASPTRSGSI